MSSRAVILIRKGIIEIKLEIPLIKLAFPRSSPTPAISPLRTISSIHGIYLRLWHNKCNKNLSENLTLKEKTWDSHWKRNVAKKWWGKSKSNNFVIRNTETLLLYLILLPARNHQQCEAIHAKFKKKCHTSLLFLPAKFLQITILLAGWLLASWAFTLLVYYIRQEKC